MNWKRIILAAAIAVQLATSAAPAVAQTLFSLPFIASKTVSVKQYGAKGDGTTDDTAAINNAIAAARDKFGPFAHGTLLGSATGYGASVYFPPGKYKVTSTLSYPGGMTFYGDSRGSSTIVFAPSATDDLFAGDATYPSRNGDWWQVTWSHLNVYGDFTTGASSNARRCFDVSGAQQFKILDCNIESFQSAVWGDEDQAYYGELRGCMFVDNQQHAFIGAATGGGGIQPVRFNNCTFRMTSTVTNATSANYPTEAIEAETPIELNGCTVESGGYVLNDDPGNYAAVRAISGVSVNGLYWEGREAIIECDWDAENRNIFLGNLYASTGSPLLFRLNNFAADNSDLASSTNWRAHIRHPYAGERLLPLIENPYLARGDTGHTLTTDLSYQTSVAFGNAPGSYLYTSTSTSSLQSKLRYTIPADQLTQYRGQRVWICGLINRNGNFLTADEGGSSQRFQVQDATASPFAYTDAPTIEYGDGWELWARQYEVPASTGDIENIYANWRLTAAIVGDDCYLGGYAVYSQDGWEMFPNVAAIGSEQKQADQYRTETLTASGAANTHGASELDSSGGALAITLADGDYIGQRKIFVMTDATASSTVSVTSHVTSDPEVFTFGAVDVYLVLMWSGTEWVTIAGDATT